MTTIQFDLPIVWFVSFLLLLVRLGGLMVFAPFLGSLTIPVQVRVTLSVALSVALFPTLQTKIPDVSMEVVPLVLMLARELMVGMLLGLAGQLLLAAFQMAGQLIGFQMGFSLVNIIDPQTQVQSSALALIEGLAGVMIFLAIDAHHWYLEAIADSYDLSFSLTSGRWSAITSSLIELFGNIFVVGFRLAAPVLTVLVIVDVFLGVIGRAAPQIHILIIGMPVKPLVGFILLSAMFQSRLPFVRQYLLHLHEQLYVFLQLLR